MVGTGGVVSCSKIAFTTTSYPLIVNVVVADVAFGTSSPPDSFPASRSHCLNLYPEFGTAVRVTSVPSVPDVGDA